MKLCAQLASRASYLGPSWPTFLMLPAQFWVTSAVPSMTMKNSFPSSPSRTLKTARQIVRVLISKEMQRQVKYVLYLLVYILTWRHWYYRKWWDVTFSRERKDLIEEKQVWPTARALARHINLRQFREPALLPCQPRTRRPPEHRRQSIVPSLADCREYAPSKEIYKSKKWMIHRQNNF